ncbi:hypothetical protein DER46DRAFT_592348 [Fusarium sp. MPI-SDFR-AT-0072]|nr:hypothetical protein DER46DRAFT_592348 [Fusarium sp. MPI-SDFR-AT-0072]
MLSISAAVFEIIVPPTSPQLSSPEPLRKCQPMARQISHSAGLPRTIIALAKICILLMFSSSHPGNSQNRESTATRAAEDGVSPTQPRSEI